jgi:hypothetical protein
MFVGEKDAACAAGRSMRILNAETGDQYWNGAIAGLGPSEGRPVDLTPLTGVVSGVVSGVVLGVVLGVVSP